MIKVDSYQGRTHPTFLSEGKLLELTPVITDASGQPMILPPVIWPVDNWVLGYMDEHAIGMPFTVYPQGYVMIPGSRSNANVRVQFIVRVLEAGDAPRPGATIDPDSVRAIVAAVRGES